mmetsp:Transcript_55134/g.107842  ORF Transcript_55134/g.107842 Transcript_55134/m.107842 type:complete len:106 (-) Transcript_55134:826-1143(-)
MPVMTLTAAKRIDLVNAAGEVFFCTQLYKGRHVPSPSNRQCTFREVMLSRPFFRNLKPSPPHPSPRLPDEGLHVWCSPPLSPTTLAGPHGAVKQLHSHHRSNRKF